ncbi:hypothetical protein CLOSTASPAR_05612 [[Clostridium] asparagiforme DSM 15981]|uniref:Uncharacterized protein n=1 Tax=[Clostridium] asparagiforme DSM 15981 TaxID=518636 RepID=C0D8L2_9FIRM|nr:hypothetical protein CLOSTASPAR_05612 [[Clostridium] asparagiforme DSM 15981]
MLNPLIPIYFLQNCQFPFKSSLFIGCFYYIIVFSYKQILKKYQLNRKNLSLFTMYQPFVEGFLE